MANIVDRTSAEVLIPKEESDQIISNIIEKSAFLKMATKLPNMSSMTREYPVQASEPIAGFVSGDTGLKPTTGMDWKNSVITAEEIAAIIPVPDNVAADSKFDIFAQLRPQLEAAAGKVVDKAAFFGTNKPDSWPTAIVTAAIAAGNVVYTPASGADMYKEIFGVGGVIAKVEEDGYFVDGMVSAMNMRAKLRDLRDKQDRPLFVQDMHNATPYTLGGITMEFPRNGSFNAETANLIAGDFTRAVYAIRQDVTFKVFDSGVISDADGKVIYNLMQNDMVALRAVMRLGWEIPNPVNAFQPDESKRSPFAVYAPAGASAANAEPTARTAAKSVK
ncbi:MAG: phage major capsid protein [Oscillospiraceae bacterium]|nr:phage major capsid protein [Oscillospiraceae bacterium]